MITIAILLALCGQPPAGAGTGPDVRCGSFCLFVALQALGKAPADHTQLEDVLGLPGLQGYSLQQLKDAAERFGARTLAVETSLDNLRHRMRGESFACLTLIDSDHFVLVKDLDSTRISIIDPPRSFRVGVDTFSASWSGKALLIAAGELRSEESVGRGRLAREYLPWLAMGGGGVLALIALTVAVRRSASRVEKGAKALIAAICIAALEAVGGCSPAVHEAPVRNWLTISDEHKDLGVILKTDEGENARRVEVGLLNEGPERLEVRDIQTSCACTLATVAPGKFIGPGQKATLTVTVRIGDVTDSNGARVYLTTNDPVEPRREIEIQWSVRTPLHSSTPALKLATLSPGEGAAHSLPLFLEGMSLCESCEISCRKTTPAVNLNAITATAARRRSHGPSPTPGAVEVGRLDVTLPPQSDERHYSELAQVEVVCAGRRLAGMKLPITWVVASAVRVSPSRLFIGETNAGVRIKKTLILQAADARPFRILGVAADSERLRSIPTESPSLDILHQLELDVEAPDAPGPWRATVRIRTDHEKSGEVSVPISGVVSPEGVGA